MWGILGLPARLQPVRGLRKRTNSWRAAESRYRQSRNDFRVAGTKEWFGLWANQATDDRPRWLKSDTMSARPFPLRLANPAFLPLLVACGESTAPPSAAGRGRRKSSRGARDHSPDVSVQRYLWERSGSTNWC